MNSKDLRNINEAYSSIYEEQVEAGQHPGKSPDKRTRDKFETQSRRGTAPKGVGVPDKSVGYGQLKQDVDMFELIKGHLMSEGFADSEEAAHAIMANMSEQWMDSIVEERIRYNKGNSSLGPEPGTPGGPARNVGIVGPPKKAIDAIPGVRGLRIAASNYRKDSERYGGKAQQVGKHRGLSRQENIKTTSGTLISPTTKFTDKSGDK